MQSNECSPSLAGGALRLSCLRVRVFLCCSCSCARPVSDSVSRFGLLHRASDVADADALARATEGDSRQKLKRTRTDESDAKFQHNSRGSLLARSLVSRGCCSEHFESQHSEEVAAAPPQGSQQAAPEERQRARCAVCCAPPCALPPSLSQCVCPPLSFVQEVLEAPAPAPPPLLCFRVFRASHRR